jgi:hypothetical protein
MSPAANTAIMVTLSIILSFLWVTGYRRLPVLAGRGVRGESQMKDSKTSCFTAYSFFIHDNKKRIPSELWKNLAVQYVEIRVSSK